MITLGTLIFAIVVCIVAFVLIGLVEDAKAQKILRTVAIVVLVLWLLVAFLGIGPGLVVGIR